MRAYLWQLELRDVLKKSETKKLSKVISTTVIKNIYHDYISILSIQHHILCHTDQSRGYM